MNNFEPWNKGQLIGQKTPLTRSQVWDIRRNLEVKEQWRDLALFSVAVDTMLRASDLLALKVGDLVDDDNKPRYQLVTKQQKTGNAVTVELSKYARDSIEMWLKAKPKSRFDYRAPLKITIFPPTPKLAGEFFEFQPEFSGLLN